MSLISGASGQISLYQGLVRPAISADLEGNAAPEWSGRYVRMEGNPAS